MLPKEAPVRSTGRLRPITLLCGLDKLWHRAFLDRTPELGGRRTLPWASFPGAGRRKYTAFCSC
eukprot:3281045-Prorocentrum_lima.AAC.1